MQLGHRCEVHCNHGKSEGAMKLGDEVDYRGLRGGSGWTLPGTCAESCLHTWRWPWHCGEGTNLQREARTPGDGLWGPQSITHGPTSIIGPVSCGPAAYPTQVQRWEGCLASGELWHAQMGDVRFHSLVCLSCPASFEHIS